MTALKAVIVEDEARSIAVLKQLLTTYFPHITVTSTVGSVVEAVSAIREIKPDIIFLDIELPDGSGFQVLEAFPQTILPVIFTTAFGHYAIKAIRNRAIDYLLKPIDVDELLAAINKIGHVSSNLVSDTYNSKTNNPKNDNRLALPTWEGLIFVSEEEILYCEADRNYTTVHLNNSESILVCKPLNYFEELLPSKAFCRTHHSFLVNTMHIQRYIKGRGGYVIMRNGAKVEISIRLKNNFLERFNR